MIYENYNIDEHGIYDLDKGYGGHLQRIDLVEFGKPETQEQLIKFMDKLRKQGEQKRGADIRALLGARGL